MTEPKWLQLARIEIGTKEVPGDGDNPVIAGYWTEAGLGDVAKGQDEVPWCAAFIGAVLARGGLKGSGKANARSYEMWGALLNGPVLGCVTVFSRPPSIWQGHVAFLIGTNKAARTVRVLGGNQGDKVSVADFALDRVVGYRWPKGEKIEPEWVGPKVDDSVAVHNPSDR